MRPLWRQYPVVCTMLVLFAVNATGEMRTNRFHIDVRRGTIRGTEIYQLNETPSGYRIHGTLQLQQAGHMTDLTQETVLRSDGGLVHYKLEGTVSGERQVIEAWPQGNHLRVSVSAAGHEQNQTLDFKANTVLLDNLVVSHYQVLLNSAAKQLKGKEYLWVLIPQSLAIVKAQLAADGEALGTFKGREIHLRKYTLTLGPVLIEIFGDAVTGDLMRVYVPAQDTEMIRQGFVQSAKPSSSVPGQAGIVNRSVSFPSGKFQMPGSLCLPARFTNPLPGVILVQGSGPLDRDETIGPNKPFRDIADGLARAGIASLRYDKRTYAFRQEIDPRTVSLDTVVIDDAVSGLDYFRRLPDVNPRDIFLLGHSLGGTLSPLIVARARWIRGVILLAPGERPVTKALMQQIALEMKIEDQSENVIRARIEQLQREFDNARSEKSPSDEMLLGAPVSYWRTLISYNAPRELSELRVPVLLLQGGKDYQVTRVDYKLAEQALAHRRGCPFESHLFPNLNHLFMRIEGKSTGAEYGLPSHVDPMVINFISAWIHAQLATPNPCL